MSLWFYVVGTAIFLVAAAIYFLPTWIAARRRHRNMVAVLAVNVLTGWTIVGWIFVLCWALIGDSDVQTN